VEFSGIFFQSLFMTRSQSGFFLGFDWCLALLKKEPELASDLKTPLKTVIFEKGQFYFVTPSLFPGMI